MKKKEPYLSNFCACLDHKKMTTNPFDSSYEEDQAAIHSETFFDSHLNSKRPESSFSNRDNTICKFGISNTICIQTAVVKRRIFNPFDSLSEEDL